MAEREILVLVNPLARHGYSVVAARRIIRALIENKIEFAVKIIGKNEDIVDLISEIDDDFEFVLAVGGDGTINRVVEGMIKHDKRHVLIPYLGGTGGELSRYTMLDSPKKVVESIVRGKSNKIDIFEAEITKGRKSEKRIIVANLQIGHFAQSIYETPLFFKKIFGSNGYMVGVLKALVKRKNKTARIQGDGKLIYEGKIYTIHLGNLKTTRGGIEVTPLAVPTDGKIDMLLARGIGRLEALKTLPSVLRGEHLSHHAVVYGQFSTLEILVDGDFVAVDGEFLGIAHKVSVGFLGKVEVLVGF